MLSSVLRSPRAVQVNVEIMRAFVRLRAMQAGNEELARKLDALEARGHEDAAERTKVAPLRRPVGDNAPIVQIPDRPMTHSGAQATTPASIP
jgi:hypothetical protein